MAYAIRKNLHDPIDTAAPDAQAASVTIFSLIEQFDYVEKLCEEALTRQEELAGSTMQPSRAVGPRRTIWSR